MFISRLLSFAERRALVSIASWCLIPLALWIQYLLFPKEMVHYHFKFWTVAFCIHLFFIPFVLIEIKKIIEHLYRKEEQCYHSFSTKKEHSFFIKQTLSLFSKLNNNGDYPPENDYPFRGGFLKITQIQFDKREFLNSSRRLNMISIVYQKNEEEVFRLVIDFNYYNNAVGLEHNITRGVYNFLFTGDKTSYREAFLKNGQLSKFSNKEIKYFKEILSSIDKNFHKKLTKNENVIDQLISSTNNSQTLNFKQEMAKKLTQKSN